MSSCERCGYAIGPGWRACPACGTPVRAAPAAPVPVTTMPAAPVPPAWADGTPLLGQPAVAQPARPAPLPRAVDDTVRLDETMLLSTVPPVAPAAAPPATAPPAAVAPTIGDPRAKLLAYVVAAAFVLGIIIALVILH